jgi:hypothetical protein
MTSQNMLAEKRSRDPASQSRQLMGEADVPVSRKNNGPGP